MRTRAGARAIAAGFACAMALFGGAVTAVADEPAPPALAVALTTIPGGENAGVTPAPTLLVYSDGRAVHSPDAATPDRPADKAPQQRNGHVPLDVVHAAAEDAKKLAAADLGMPKDGSGGSTLLDFLGSTPDQDVHLVVYSPGGTDGLTDAQKADRTRFADLCKKLVDGFVADR
ncbi:hypothetical protein [Nocardia veterana]|uniref:Secreted protein n=1 Tax=Nocardia veterana TaxID=132249 RepID=A0A7X6LYM9_9NOCA|nr:hypothetical protein [Nocardia veterana]NKY86972.1 hypothetical protein [Nocardia veterana]